jgi:xylulokinase
LKEQQIMKRFLLAHDLGTSGNKASVYTIEGEFIKSLVYPYNTRYFNEVWVEQNPSDWWDAVANTTRAFLQTIPAEEIAAVSFSGQMMGCLCVDRNGKPLKDSIIWADMRSTAEAKKIEDKLGGEAFYGITGHRISSSYSLSKLTWIKKHEPDIYRQTYKMLNAKDYVIYRLTGKFATEYSDASGTNAFNLNTFEWSDPILDAAGIDKDKLPDLYASTHVIGGVTRRAAQITGLAEGTPVVMGGGDGMCASVGAGCIREGVAYNYLGSSSWISISTKKPLLDKKMRTFNWAHIVPGYIAPCGTMQCAGGSYSWLKENICLHEADIAQKKGENVYELINRQAEQSPAGANGVLYMPYLIGERSPRWNSLAKGAFLGLKMENNHADICRAVMEGVILNLNVILSIFQGFEPLKDMTVIGGGGKGRAWLRIMADVYGLPIKKSSRLEEATSIGAAVTAGVGVGLLSGFDCVDRFVQVEEKIDPMPKNSARYEKSKRLFEACYEALEPVFPLFQRDAAATDG